MEKRNNKKSLKREYLLSIGYIDWLEEFTDLYENFSTDLYIYEENSTNEESNNVFLLETLFEVIAAYADENYITPGVRDCELFYNIKHNNIGYEIGFDYGQGSSFYCLRQEKPKETAIEYDTIMNKTKLPSTIKAEKKLKVLKELIEMLIDEDVPPEAIKQTTDTIIQKVKTKKRSYK